MRQTCLTREKDKNGAVDSVDLRIMNVLQEDCRLSFHKIAARTGISVGTAYNRVKKLEEKRLLKQCTILVDSVKLGYPLTAVIFVQVEGENLSEVENFIAQSNNVTCVYEVTGEFDTVAVAKFKNREELNTFIKCLAAVKHVKRTITNVSLNTVKEDFRLTFSLEKSKT